MLILLYSIENVSFIFQSVFTWGRRMSKKFELLRRNDSSRKMHEDGSSSRKLCPSASGDLLNGRSVFSLKNMPKPGDEPIPTSMATPTPPPPSSSSSSTIINNYSFKTFFHRIGSTGMLSRSSNIQSNSKQLNDSRTLYRSSSTSQLNTPSYVKGDDPTDGINLCNRTKTHEAKINNIDNTHVNDNYLNKKTPVKAASYDDIAHVAANEPQASKRSNFPYAFLRSKLSVLPEENGGSVINQKRILQEMQMLDNGSIEFKAAQPVIHNDKNGDDSSSSNGGGGGGISGQRHQQITEDVTMIENSNTEHSTPNEDGNCDLHSQSPRFTYQRFSSCFSSNESGYDSDSRHTEDQNGIKSTTPKEEFSVRRLSAKLTPQLSSIRKRYKHVKLQRKSPNDVIGIEVTPIDNEIGLECRYIVSNLSGLALADGRICIGDEVVNVNCINLNRCIDLRGMKSYEKYGAYGTVQEMLSTFVDDSVELVITHDEPTTCGDRLNDRDTKHKADLHLGKFFIDFFFV